MQESLGSRCRTVSMQRLPEQSCMRSSAPAGRSRRVQAQDWRRSQRVRFSQPASPTNKTSFLCGWHHLGLQSPFLLLAVLKMGWVAQFLSRAVVTGFLFGAAIDVVIGELPKLTGTEVDGTNSLQELWSWLGT